MRFHACLIAIAISFSHVSKPCSAQVDGQTVVKQQPTAAGLRADDTVAIRKMIDSFAETFEARDAKSLAAYFTVEGEFENEQGLKVRGRKALERAFGDFFAQTPEVKAQVHAEAFRFLSENSAIDEGIVTVQRGPAEAATKARYTALVVRENGVWRLAMMNEFPGGNEPSIDDLGWLIGDWRSVSGQGAEIQTTYAWDRGNRFIRMEFMLHETQLALAGRQTIGVDPATGVIHSWTFESSGGIGEADWYRDGDHWVLDAVGTLADGSTLVETNILRRIDNDTFTWQSTDRLLNDTELADLAPVKVTRVKPQP